MEHHSTTGPPGTQAVTRAFAVLKAFSDARPRWRVGELAAALTLPKPTIVRLLAALEHEGMVARDGATNSWTLGPGAIALGSLALRTNDLRTMARPELEMLAHASGETTSLEVLIGTEVLIVEEVRVAHLLGTTAEVGTRWPAHATSTGKALMAAGESTDLPEELAGYTPRTITSKAKLRDELEVVARRGYAIAVEELVEGYVAIAAPVRDHAGNTVGALSIGGPTVRLTPERLPQLGALVSEAAQRVSRRLGGA